MNTKCKRCQGKKTYRKQCCVKCGGKGFLSKQDRDLMKQIKTRYRVSIV